MKNVRRISIIIIALLLLVGLCACNILPQTQTEIYDKLNKMLDDDYSTIALTITTTTVDVPLTSSFNTIFKDNRQSITYSVQQFGKFEVNDGVITPPSSYIVTKSGTIALENGKVVDKQGDEMDIDVSTLTSSIFSFKKEYFANIKSNKTSFSADVTNAKGFMSNNTLNVSDMKVSVGISGDKIASIIITYTSENDASIKMHYTFS